MKILHGALPYVRTESNPKPRRDLRSQPCGATMSSALRARLRRAPISYTRVVQFQCESGPPDSLKRYTREQKASLHFRHDRVLTLQVGLAAGEPTSNFCHLPFPLACRCLRTSLELGPFRFFASILADAGISAQAVFDQADIELSLFQDPDNRIPFEAAGRLLETSARLARLPIWGSVWGLCGAIGKFWPGWRICPHGSNGWRRASRFR